MGMAKIAKTWCVGKGGHQDCYEHVPHQILWVQRHWKVHHLPVCVHGDGPNGPRLHKLGVLGKVAIMTTTVHVNDPNWYTANAARKSIEPLPSYFIHIELVYLIHNMHTEENHLILDHTQDTNSYEVS